MIPRNTLCHIEAAKELIIAVAQRQHGHGVTQHSVCVFFVVGGRGVGSSRNIGVYFMVFRRVCFLLVSL